MACATRLYSGFATLFAATVGPLFALHARGRRRLHERFGSWRLELPEVVWFHGASLGEMNGLVPLMRRWRATNPTVPILATATSTTGLERAAEVATLVRLVPFDTPICIRRALGDTRIRAFIFGETEIWPSLIAELESRAVPRCMVNARIGAASYRRYQRFGRLFRPAFAALTEVCAVSAEDERRLVELGVDPSRCRTVGNAKYDLGEAVIAEADKTQLSDFLGLARAPVIVLGSLRPGEEERWFPILQRNRAESLTVVVAPRHPEKFDFFAAALRGAGVPFRRRTAGEGPPVTAGLDVVLLDSLGELRNFYSAAALAFVGGSLVDWGGHNPLEPALWGVPVAIGPATSSVAEIVAALSGAGAVLPLTDDASIAAVVDRVITRDPELGVIGKRGKVVAERFTGAADVIFHRVCQVLKSAQESHAS